MKKIFIANTDLDVGGGENSLVSFLANMDLDLCQVDLGILQPKLGMADRLDFRINIIKLYENPTLGEYDTAIGYKQGKSTAFAVNRVKAKRKIAFFRHGTIKYKGISKLYYRNIYRKTDCIITLNEDLKNRLSQHFSIPPEKIAIVEDLFDRDEFEKKSAEYTVEKDADYILSTVSRIVPVKKIDLIPLIAFNLTLGGISNFKWYIVGDYKDRKYYDKCVSLAKHFNLCDRIIFTGEKSNPMPYIKASDLYVHVSEAESWCRSITEALALRVPVLSTDTIGGKAQIISGKNGQLCQTNNMDDICEKLISMLENIKDIKANQPEFTQNNRQIMEKYYRLF